MALGALQQGYKGALAAWLGFTLPSAALLILFALGLSNYGEQLAPGWLHGLKIAAVAVVAQAVWGMYSNLCQGRQRLALMLASAMITLYFKSAHSQWFAIMVAAGIGSWWLRNVTHPPATPSDRLLPLSPTVAISCLVLFILLLCLLPLLAAGHPHSSLSEFAALFRVGSLVFGGGHVVLPLLHQETVLTGWVSENTFLTGYGAAQAIPGPLFTFAAFLGAAKVTAPSGIAGGLWYLVAIFLPSFLLVLGILPFWHRLRVNPVMQAALAGVNAAVVGLLLAAFIHPIAGSALHNVGDAVLALLTLFALVHLKIPAWLVVMLCAGASFLLSRV